MDKECTDVAERVRNACINAAREGFQDAAISGLCAEGAMEGLCAEGAMEAAISAMQKLDLEKIIQGKE